MLKLFLGSLLIGAVAIAADRPEAPTPAVEITAATTTTTTTKKPPMTTTTTTKPPATTTTITTSVPVQSKAQNVAVSAYRHPHWVALARQIGWPESELDRLDHVIHRESRGIPTAHNTDDPMSGSRGLTQVNGFWCKRNRYEPNPAGFLGAAGVLDSCEDLFDPETNLRAALTIWRYGVEEHRCGWGPWQTKGFRPCKR
jgi:hypothetical protein